MLQFKEETRKDKNFQTNIKYTVEGLPGKTFIPHQLQLIVVTYLTMKDGSTSKISEYPVDTDVFKTFSGRLKKLTTSYDQTRRRHDVWKKTLDLPRLEDVWFMSFWRRPIYNVLKTSNLWRLQDVWFTMSWRRLTYVILRRPI